MASNTVAVRLPEEVLSELQRVADLQNKKVSDIVRALIVDGLMKPGGDKNLEVIERLDRLEQLILIASKAAIKAQYLANLSASYSVDVSRLMSGSPVPTAEEKSQYLTQMSEWAEQFAIGELRLDLAQEAQPDESNEET
jgi:hypothetical protein